MKTIICALSRIKISLKIKKIHIFYKVWYKMIFDWMNLFGFDEPRKKYEFGSNCMKLVLNLTNMKIIFSFLLK